MNSIPNNPALVYSVRRSQRARRTRIEVRADSIVVVAPQHVPEPAIRAFVAARQDWIRAAHLRVIARNQQLPTPTPGSYAEDTCIPYQGNSVPLTICRTARRSVGIELRQEATFVASVPAELTGDALSEAVRAALVHWMKAQARLHFVRLIAQHAPRHGLYPRSLKIKSQKSRWGSCGPRDDINLNWLLMLAPPAVMEYVVVHELCHIRHKHHAGTFWELVAEHLPAYQQQRLWLKQHGTSLMQGL